MYLYLIYCKDHTAWYVRNTYDRAVVCAKNKEDAAKIHPSGKENWNGAGGSFESWTDVDNVVVKLLGTAKKGTKAGVICASYRK